MSLKKTTKERLILIPNYYSKSENIINWAKSKIFYHLMVDLYIDLKILKEKIDI